MDNCGCAGVDFCDDTGGGVCCENCALMMVCRRLLAGVLPEDHSAACLHVVVVVGGEFWWLVCLSRVDDALELSRYLWQARARRFVGAWVSGGGSA